MSKYNNIKCSFRGIKFDSKKELEYYIILLDRLKHNEISNLKRQVKFELQPSYKFNNKLIRSITYIADFTYQENGQLKVIDTKGYRTEVYKLKKKLFEYKYGIEIEEV